MMKFDKNKAKSVISRKKQEKKTKTPREIRQYVDSLLELHKLQGVLLRQLKNEI